jgi:hypothetical protein
MVKAAQSSARNAALMQFCGSNPISNLQAVLRRIEEQYRSTDADGVKNFRRQQNSYHAINIFDVMARLDGTAALRRNELTAKIGNTIRQFYNMVYLGAVGITHLSSLPATFTSEARFSGINAFSSLGQLMSSLVKGLGTAERREVLEQLGAYGEGIARNAQNFFPNGGWDTPGVIAAMHSKFMKATVLPYIFDHAKAGMKEMLANKLAREIAKPFDQLEAHMQQTLKGYGITPEIWKLLKAGDLLKTPSNRVYLTPRITDSLKDAPIENLLRSTGAIAQDDEADAVQKAITGFRRDLSDKLGMLFYEDAADHAVVAPGVREQAFLQGRLAPGSGPSEMLHMLMQFKTWPLAALHQKLGREYYEGLSRGDKIWGIGLLTGLSMLGGYIRMTARDLAYGDQPRTPRNVGDAFKIGGAAIAQGGGLGLLGDYLFGEINRLGAGAASGGGPIGTDLGRLTEIYNRTMREIGDEKHTPGDLWPELARFGLGHIPFANLFYTKAAFDYLVAYHMFEGLKPG